MSDCPIIGLAIIQQRDNGPHYWVQTDPEIHIAQELLDDADEDGMAFLTATYELGEPCPYQQGVIHARLKDRP